MSKISGFKCDFCDELFYEADAQKVTTIVIPGVTIGRMTFRLNDGHICSECGKRLSDALEPVRENIEKPSEQAYAERPLGE